MGSLARRVASLGLLALAGCPLHFASVQTAETLGKDNMQVGLEPGLWSLGTQDGGAAVLPVMAVAFRYGLTDRLDLGGRIGLALYVPHWDFQLKYQLTAPDSDGPIVSIAPWLGIIGVGAGGSSIFWASVHVPVLIGIPIGKSELTLGPRVALWSLSGAGGGESGTGALVFAGTSVGFAARLGEGVRILPEVTVMTPVAGGVALPAFGSDWGSIDAGVFAIDFRLGFLLGKTR